MLDIIVKRKEQDEYLQRLHIGLQATAIVKAVGAAFDKKEISINDLIGKPPNEEKNNTKDNEENINEWKENAKQKGLKAGN